MIWMMRFRSEWFLDAEARIQDSVTLEVEAAVKCVVIFLALAALFAGLKAAWEWYRASNVEIDPGYDYPGAPPTYRRMDMEFPRTSEPGIPELQRMNEIMAAWAAIQESSKINKYAAIWTASSVAFGALSSVLSPIS